MKTKTKAEMEVLFKSRFVLGAVQRAFETKFNIPFISLEKVKSPEFLSTFQTWDEMKKRGFIIELGGPANFKHTQNYFNNLIKATFPNKLKPVNQKFVIDTTKLAKSIKHCERNSL